MDSPRKKTRQQSPKAKKPHRPAVSWVAGVLLLAAFAVGALMWTKRNTLTGADSNASKSMHLAILPDERSVFATYARSASCQHCHEEAFAEWLSSDHRLAERPPNVELDRRAFDPARTIQQGGQATSVRFDGTNYLVTTSGLNRTDEVHSVVRVIGRDPLRQFLVGAPGGRLQTLEASYDPRSNQWFNVFGSENRQPGEWGHWTGHGMNWNSMCASCHNTRVRKNYEETTDSYHTTMAEPAVGCESCHGPLKAHNDWQAQFGKSGKPDPTVLKLSKSQILDNCGFCHSRMENITGDFKPGDDFSAHAQLTIVDASEIYYPDGQVREEDYEYASFLSSKMHMNGVTCLDCHNAHSLKARLPGNWLCMRCHDGSYPSAPTINPVAHSRHKVFGYDPSGVVTNRDLSKYGSIQIKETGGECVNCHMPQTVYMQRDSRHDHGFTIPDPLLTKQLGIPNACNRCHQEKDADWALKYCDEWYGTKMDRPSRSRAQVIAAVRAGDSKARDGLLELLSKESNSYWRAVAVGLLSQWAGEPAVSNTLLKTLRDTNALVRAESVRALSPRAEAHSPMAVESIRPALDDPDRNVRLTAAWALRSEIDPASPAGNELAHMLDVNADQPAGQMQKAAYALAHHDSESALAHYQKAVEWDPNSAPIRHDYAVVLAQLNRSAEAVTQLEVACKLDPSNAEYLFKLALALNETGQSAKVMEALRAAVRLDPSHARAWYNLGLAENNAGHKEEGLAALLRAESASPDDPQIPYARATILAQLGRQAEARQAASRALQMEPGYLPAQNLLRSLARQ